MKATKYNMMNIKSIMLSEKRQAQKFHLYNILKKDKSTEQKSDQ